MAEALNRDYREQLVVRTGLKPETSRIQVQRPIHLATLGRALSQRRGAQSYISPLSLFRAAMYASYFKLFLFI